MLKKGIVYKEAEINYYMNFIQMNGNELSRSSGDDPSGDFHRVANGMAAEVATASSNNDTDMGDNKKINQGQLKSEDGVVINNIISTNDGNDFMQQLQYQQEVMQQQMFAMNNGIGIGGLMGGLSNNMTIPLKNGDDNSNNNTTQHIKTMEVDINGAGGSMGQQQPDDSIHRVSGNTTDFEIPVIAPPQVENNNSSATASEDNSSSTSPPPQKEKSKRRPSSTRKSSPSKSKKNTDDDDEPMDIFHGKGSFPLNLTLMLESVHSMELNHIVSWSDSGTSFIMHDPALFLTEVMPTFFK